MEWIGVKVDWIKKIKFFAHPYQGATDFSSSERKVAH